MNLYRSFCIIFFSILFCSFNTLRAAQHVAAVTAGSSEAESKHRAAELEKLPLFLDCGMTKWLELPSGSPGSQAERTEIISAVYFISHQGEPVAVVKNGEQYWFFDISTQNGCRPISNPLKGSTPNDVVNSQPVIGQRRAAHEIIVDAATSNWRGLVGDAIMISDTIYFFIQKTYPSRVEYHDLGTCSARKRVEPSPELYVYKIDLSLVRKLGSLDKSERNVLLRIISRSKGRCAEFTVIEKEESEFLEKLSAFNKTLYDNLERWCGPFLYVPDAVQADPEPSVPAITVAPKKAHAIAAQEVQPVAEQEPVARCIMQDIMNNKRVVLAVTAIAGLLVYRNWSQIKQLALRLMNSLHYACVKKC